MPIKSEHQAYFEAAWIHLGYDCDQINQLKAKFAFETPDPTQLSSKEFKAAVAKIKKSQKVIIGDPKNPPIMKEPIEEAVEVVPEPPPISPVLKRRQARLERKQAKADALARAEEERNKVFEDLSEDDWIFVEKMQEQGLTIEQVRNVLLAKKAKKLGKEG